MANLKDMTHKSTILSDNQDIFALQVFGDVREQLLKDHIEFLQKLDGNKMYGIK